MRNDFHTRAVKIFSPFERAANNIAALRLLAQDKEDYTLEEQEVLSNYSGWGMTTVVNAVENQLKDMFENDSPEFESIRSGTLNQHYTHPDVVDAMHTLLEWGGAYRDTGKLLEVGDFSAGAGIFNTRTPEHLRERLHWTQLDKDVHATKVLAGLHPSSRVLCSPFEATALPSDYYDIAVTNVPFANIRVKDHQIGDQFRKSVHDYYFVKTLSLLKPGGVIAYITSRYTMDKVSASVRSYLNQGTRFFGAIRLPSSTFTKIAGTEVVTDIIFLQKTHETKVATLSDTWLLSENRMYAGTYSRTTAKLNNWWRDNLECILGRERASSSMYSDNQYNVEGFVSPQDIVAAGKRFIQEGAFIDEATKVFQISVTVEVKEVEERVLTPIEKHAGILYDAFKATLESDVKCGNNTARNALNRAYKHFINDHGPVRSKKVKTGLKNLDVYPNLCALEKTYDVATNTATVADVFRMAVINAEPVISEILSIPDAFVACLARKAQIDIEYIADLSASAPDNVTAELEGRMMFWHAGKWETEGEFLSGNIVKKLGEYKALADLDPKRFRIYSEALESVRPIKLELSKIGIRPSSSWLSSDLLVKFARFILCGGGDRDVEPDDRLARNLGIEVQYAKGSNWKLIMHGQEFYTSSIAKERFGTDEVSALIVVGDALANNMRIISREVNGKSVRDEKATIAVTQKREAVEAAFRPWVEMDPARVVEVEEMFNDKVNVIALRNWKPYTTFFPGLAKHINPYIFQMEAVSKILMDPHKTTLLDHSVGSGKTWTTVIAIMEAKRLGISNRALITVMNSAVEQWRNAILEAYPTAVVIVLEAKDMRPDKRKEFLARMASSKADIYLMPYTAFQRFAPSNVVTEKFIRMQIAELRVALSETDDSRSWGGSMKNTQKAIERLEAKLTDLLESPKDDLIMTFDQLGITMLVVDEFHNFKNLFFTHHLGRITGLSNSSSKRAEDMFMKFMYTISRNRIVVTLTGSPFSNTIAEIYNMLRYHRPDLMNEFYLNSFDEFISAFGIPVQGVEMSPDGSSFRMVTRFKKFVNPMQLRNLWTQFAHTYDLFGDKDRPMKIPTCLGERGGYIKVVLPPSDELIEYTAKLADRAEEVRGGCDPSEDNMLKITNDLRKSTLQLTTKDGRLVKVDALVDTVWRIWNASKRNKGAQVIFCDMGTPKARKDVVIEVESTSDEYEAEFVVTDAEATIINDLYAQIRSLLVVNGVPAEQIAFIHDAKTPTDKTRMFAKVNSGEIRVILGSTEKLGVGVNIQRRLVALHHLSYPWRPSDMIQRDGRIERQGNNWDAIAKFVYIIQASGDGFLWQTLEAKRATLSSFRTCTAGMEIEDIDAQLMSYANIKAISSGNEEFIKLADIESQLAQMFASRNDFYSRKHNTQRAMSDMVKKLEENKAYVHHGEEAARLINAWPEDKSNEVVIFDEHISVDYKTVSTAIRDAVYATKIGQRRIIGSMNGVTLVARCTKPEGMSISFTAGFMIGREAFYFAVSDASEGGVARSAFARLRALPADVVKTKEGIERAEIEIKTMEQILSATWAQEDEYRTLEKQRLELAALIAQKTSDSKKSNVVIEVDLSWVPIYENAILSIQAMDEAMTLDVDVSADQEFIPDPAFGSIIEHMPESVLEEENLSWGDWAKAHDYTVKKKVVKKLTPVDIILGGVKPVQYTFF